MKSGVFLVAFCARLKTYGALFGDKNHKAFSRFCLCGHEKSGLSGDLCVSCGRSKEDIRKWKRMKRPEKMAAVQRANMRLKGLKKTQG